MATTAESVTVIVNYGPFLIPTDDTITLRDASFYLTKQQMLDLRKQVSIIEEICGHFFLKMKWEKSRIYADTTWRTY